MLEPKLVASASPYAHVSDLWVWMREHASVKRGSTASEKIHSPKPCGPMGVRNYLQRPGGVHRGFRNRPYIYICI